MQAKLVLGVHNRRLDILRSSRRECFVTAGKLGLEPVWRHVDHIRNTSPLDDPTSMDPLPFGIEILVGRMKEVPSGLGAAVRPVAGQALAVAPPSTPFLFPPKSKGPDAISIDNAKRAKVAEVHL